ncbi:MAG: adenylate/guanylate cyclase domain-containing protein [Bacteroidales bacterium]|nr:adenylate/guanylate cyclase domain-containing protein [Bacteroidales bacterium]
MTETPVRKRSTIVFTDIAGYSQMMNKHEEQALKLLDFHDSIAREIFAVHNGKIIKNLGDGMLAVFNSVREAMEASVTFQNEIKEYNANHANGDKLLVRIGIHVGEVFERGGDIFGNDVNVAARLQQICTPGGICLSQNAHTLLGKASDETFIEIQNVKLKNIAEDYTVFQIPSIYPNLFPHDGLPDENLGNKNVVITSIRKISPEKFALIDTLIVAAGLMIIIDFGIVNALVYFENITFNQAIIKLSNVWMLVYNIFFLTVFTVILLRDAVEIKFEDVRGVDRLLSYIIQRFGFKPPVKKSGQIIFKPTFYNLLMWSTQKMRVAINGNNVTISGSYLFLRKVKKMLETYQK